MSEQESPLEKLADALNVPRKPSGFMTTLIAGQTVDVAPLKSESEKQLEQELENERQKSLYHERAAIERKTDEELTGYLRSNQLGNMWFWHLTELVFRHQGALRLLTEDLPQTKPNVSPQNHTAETNSGIKAALTDSLTPKDILLLIIGGITLPILTGIACKAVGLW